MEGMDLQSVHLSEINPLSDGFKVKVKFDRPFKRQWVQSYGPNRTPVVELLSLDVVLYDQEVWHVRILQFLCISVLIFCILDVWSASSLTDTHGVEHRREPA